MPHVVPEHAYGAQTLVVASGHAPFPSQLAASTCTPPLQSAVRHGVVGYAHAVVVAPSHAPAHEVPSEAHAARPPTGSPVTAEHVPALPVRLHAPHCSPQLVEQHTPSTQNALRHWFAAVHAEPGGSCETHAPLLQKFPAAQSVSRMHEPLQTFPVESQAKGAQSFGAGVGQLPPLQNTTGSSTPPEHVPPAHADDEAVQLSPPAHVPTQAPLPEQLRPRVGELVATHVPPEHRSHVPPQDLLQHTPSQH